MALAPQKDWIQLPDSMSLYCRTGERELIVAVVTNFASVSQYQFNPIHISQPIFPTSIQKLPFQREIEHALIP
jgi:hypothetical protein